MAANETPRSADAPEGALSDDEREKVASSPTPPEAWIIHEIIREDGERELRRSVSSLVWSGLGAGLSMGFSFLTLAMIRAALPDTPAAILIAGFGYTIGFLIAILGRQQLFTESTLTAVLPFLMRRDRQSFVAMLRLWGAVLVANLVGTIAFAAFISVPDLFGPTVVASLRHVAAAALHDPFLITMLKAVLSGWLIAIMVWLLPGAGPARLTLIIALTYVVAVGQFPHIIAGSVEVAYAVFTDEASVRDYLVRFLLPTLIGNTIGGVSLVAILNHAPVRDEIAAKRTE